MTIATGFTTRTPMLEAVMDIRISFGTMTPKLVVYFASPRYDLEPLAEGLHRETGAGVVIGCTTAGEIVSGRMQEGGISGMAMDEEVIDDVAVQVVENLSSAPDVAGAFRAFEEHFGMSMMDMDPEQYVGLVLSDGLSRAEESLLDTMGNLTNVHFVGGSAGDDQHYVKTHVFANGKVYDNAAVLVLIKPKAKFHVAKTQSFKPLGKTLTATRVDKTRREVLEFDGKPAIQAYAEALGVGVGEVPALITAHPLALMDGDEPFIRAPYKASDDGLGFLCSVHEGAELMLVEATDIIEDTQKVVDEAVEKLGTVGGILNFHCVLRTMELERAERLQEYADIFADIPTSGFSTYGEAYIGYVNQSATLLFFQKPKRKTFLDDL